MEGVRGVRRGWEGHDEWVEWQEGEGRRGLNLGHIYEYGKNRTEKKKAKK